MWPHLPNPLDGNLEFFQGAIMPHPSEGFPEQKPGSENFQETSSVSQSSTQEGSTGSSATSAENSPAKPPVSKNQNFQKPPVSNRKRRANRMNSQRSSGPKTESGKRASSRNAVKHGILASKTISTALGESRADFNAVLRELRDVWEPVGLREERDVEEIAKTTWRKERVLRAEIGELAKGMNAYWSKTWDRQEQFSLDRLEWEAMHVQAELTLYQGNKKSLLEQLRECDETIHKLRRTRDGIDFVSGCVKTVRTEVEKTETLSETNLGLLLDCLGTSG
jgi:hypothetical protein